jgi:SOS-response transcriptional repressor LexA
MDTQETISKKIRQILKERNIPVKRFGSQLGIHNFGRMLNNERNWTLWNLEKVASALGVSVGSLTQQQADVPIILDIGQEPFSFPHEIGRASALKWVSVPNEDGGVSVLARMYGIRIRDNSYSPVLKEGATLIAQKETYKEIESGDIVVYCLPEGSGRIGKVFMMNDKVLFKPINPRDPEETLLDRGQIRMMDKVVFIKL